jgi:hypothetical protein
MKHIRLFEDKFDRDSFEIEKLEKDYVITQVSFDEYRKLICESISFERRVVDYLLGMKLIYGSKMEIGFIGGGGVMTMYIVDDFSHLDDSGNRIVISYLEDDYYLVHDIRRKDGMIRYYKCDNVVGLVILLNRLFRVYKSDILSNIEKMTGL